VGVALTSALAPVLLLCQGTVIQGDIYVSAVPVDLLKKLVPEKMKQK
jgi:hypothetical protein